MTGHTHIEGGVPQGAIDGAAWAAPGELVKVREAERWGRTRLLWRCCGALEVEFLAFGEHNTETATVTEAQLENPWADYPCNLPPRGYPVPAKF